jgi:hypothetical protein
VMTLFNKQPCNERSYWFLLTAFIPM